MKLGRQRISLLLKNDDPCPWSQVRLQFTGEPPGNPSECLIKEIAGECKSVHLSWLREQVSETLYEAVLRRGGWAVDIGLWGPTAFAYEADRILTELRPRFACFISEGGARLRKENGC